MKPTHLLMGIEAAQKNDTRRVGRVPRWDKPWRNHCLMCTDAVYYDGRIYWTLCLEHLEETECGPFKKTYDDDEKLGYGHWLLNC